VQVGERVDRSGQLLERGDLAGEHAEGAQVVGAAHGRFEHGHAVAHAADLQVAADEEQDGGKGRAQAVDHGRALHDRLDHLPERFRRVRSLPGQIREAERTADGI
jgi:hypothetical protein